MAEIASAVPERLGCCHGPTQAQGPYPNMTLITATRIITTDIPHPDGRDPKDNATIKKRAIQIATQQVANLLNTLTLYWLINLPRFKQYSDAYKALLGPPRTHP